MDSEYEGSVREAQSGARIHVNAGWIIHRDTPAASSLVTHPRRSTLSIRSRSMNPYAARDRPTHIAPRTSSLEMVAVGAD